MQQPTPVVLQNPIPHQGVINTQQDTQPTPPQSGQYLKPNNPRDRTILLTSEDKIPHTTKVVTDSNPMQYLLSHR
jgi:hypothetical protein